MRPADERSFSNTGALPLRIKVPRAIAILLLLGNGSYERLENGVMITMAKPRAVSLKLHIFDGKQSSIQADHQQKPSFDFLQLPARGPRVGIIGAEDHKLNPNSITQCLFRNRS